jgi:ubiquinone biosynthesis protein COQ9
LTSPLAQSERARLIAAILPEVAFDGWSHLALRAAARRLDMPAAEALALFPGGGADLVDAFAHWADERMLDRLEEAPPQEGQRLAERVASAIAIRLEILEPWREAVRRTLPVLAMPQNALVGPRLAYRTADAIWYAVGDEATDFSFYTKRASLAALHAAAVLYWLEDRSEGFADTRAFIARRLADLAGIGRARRSIARAFDRLPDPLRLLRPLP